MGYSLIIFTTIDFPNAYTWTTMIRGYVEIKFPEKAIEFYNRMRSEGINPNKFTFIFILKAYSLIPANSEGRTVHGKILKAGFQFDIFIRTALIQLYCKCGDLGSGLLLFDEVSCKNVVTWNTMLAGSFNCGEIETAEKLFSMIPERNVASWNAAITGYSKWGLLETARSMFDGMPERDLLSWSAMIAGYAQSRRATEAIELFQKMLHVGFRPDGITMVSVLLACSHIGALDMGKWIHAYVDKNKLRHDVVLGTALVDMYAKSGCIDIALQVFYSMAQRNVLSWNAIICGLAMHGYGHQALQLFTQMEQEHIQPNDITFVGVLSACSHIGLVEEGQRHFYRMKKKYRIVPKIEHYGCMVDVLGRAGLIEEAKQLVKSMPMEPNVVVWGSLLHACIIHGDIHEGEHVGKRLLKLSPGDGGYYAILSNIYALNGRWDEVAKMRNGMRERRLEKMPGCTSIEVDSVIHEFVANNKKHPNWHKISETLCRLTIILKDEGYVPNHLLNLYHIDDKHIP
ncbi:pentatricopeptide repeat-containing protein At1g08070, chloroplastic-like [Aristolochia californica]|uniref:pentatricopeptide repeat-containing protein At1g08070, chloroplastic-like n=1 Tax=Aristolochia californica TaxID=171875 RepID=UPI0035DB7368